MYLLTGNNEVGPALTRRLQQLSLLLFAELPAPSASVTLQAGEAVDSAVPADHWAFLSGGQVRGIQAQQGVVEYEAGDLLGLTGGYALPDFSYVAQQPSTLNLYPVGDVLRHLHLSKQRAAQWTAYLLTHISLLQQTVTGDASNAPTTGSGFLQFAPGEVMIREGELAGEVYHVVQGHADVYRGDTKVGEVLPGELFGAMAMLCGTPRTATVIARDDVLVAAVPQDDFQSLISRHPETAVTLMENMARAINDLNDRLRQHETTTL
ncbi:cyclic nucleotide-binding domain-containing protein [Salinispirillum sp. LH 10-3-1]|uniref:Cyclic nucleotide-binding domain-containing protein n=1 Tax=Salinispirillum sp. LH 10-3-1 TaxID=2952525 RepID=A0AB38YF25_9GAMM